jgi:hypothetical protein
VLVDGTIVLPNAEKSRLQRHSLQSRLSVNCLSQEGQAGKIPDNPVSKALGQVALFNDGDYFRLPDYWGIEKASDPLFSHSPQRNKLEVATPRRFGGIPSGLLGKLCPSMEQRNRAVV